MNRLPVALATALVCAPSYLCATEVAPGPTIGPSSERGPTVTATDTEVRSTGHLIIEAADKLILRASGTGAFKMRRDGRLDIATPVGVQEPAPEKTGFYTTARDARLSDPDERGGLFHDSGPNNDPITVKVDDIVQPPNGTVVVAPNDSFTHTPAPHFSGVDVLNPG